MTVVSFNIRNDTPQDGDNSWDTRKDAVCVMVDQYRPSVMGIQEALAHQVDFLDSNLADYESIGVGRDDGERGGEFNSIYWIRNEFGLVGGGTFWLSETPEVPSSGWDAACRRIVTWVHLRPLSGSDGFYVFNTHFDHKGVEARKQSAVLLMARINQITTPEAAAYVAGDFNAFPTSTILDPLREELFNSGSTAPQSDSRPSFNGWGGTVLPRTIDFIFYRNANVISYTTINDDFGVPFISDHYPIRAEFLQ